ncbi:MAG TPA: response regulator transcription factor [Dehalococcoidia bacterium]|nr:response regulator transcription factor [Dehalococcoidia bacterium]
MGVAIHIVDASGWSERAVPALRQAGFVTLRVDTRDAAERLIRRRPPDHIIAVDAAPRLDALEATHWLMAATTAPITVVIRGDDERRALGCFAAGADDVVSADCPPRVLIARLRAVLRRVGAPAGDGVGPVAIGEIRVEPESHQALVRGRPVHLTPLEFALLHALMRDPGVVYTREDLLDAVWGARDMAVERTIDAHVWKLRRKIASHGGQPEHIVSVPHFGYRFRRPDEALQALPALAG